MPFAFALLVSAALHVSVALLGDWTLPEVTVSEAMPIDANLVRPPVMAAAEAAAVSPKPLPRTRAPRTASPQSNVKSTEPAVVAKASETPVIGEPPVPPVPQPPQTETVPYDPVIEPATPAVPTVRIVQNLPPKGRARYSVSKGERGLLIGQSEHEWEHADGQYHLRSTTETVGLAALFKPVRVIQESRGTIDALGLHPQSFRNEQVKRTDSAAIDRAAKKVRNGDREDDLGAWLGTVQDMLSMYYQLNMIAAGLSGASPDATPGIDLPIVTGRKLAMYHFDVRGRERLNNAQFDLDAVRVRALNGEDVIDFWFAPELSFLPLRMRFVDRKGDVFDQWIDENSLGKKP